MKIVMVRDTEMKSDLYSAGHLRYKMVRGVDCCVSSWGLKPNLLVSKLFHDEHICPSK